MSKKSLFAGLLFAAVLAVANASGASAGEVKGPSGSDPESEPQARLMRTRSVSSRG